jgi:hypothetical protein
MATIDDLWQEHKTGPFPAACRGRDIEGVDFVVLDSNIAGCVSTFLERGRVLDLWRTATLGVCYRNVTYVLPRMPAEGREHFSRLEQLARLVLDAIREQESAGSRFGSEAALRGMTRKMSREFVRARIERILEVLASSATDQQTYLERLGSSPNADELALELDDCVAMLPAAVRDGALSEEQAAAIRQVSDFTGSFSGRENTALWHVDQLGSASQWTEVRRLAIVALQTLRDPGGGA